MKVERLAIPDVIRIVPQRFCDGRGYFSETYNSKRLLEIGINCTFVQDNQALSRQRWTLRGLHCQISPQEQGKLMHVLRGAVWDVAVDVRSRSSSFGRWVAATLSATGGEQLWIPPGFLHGYLTLEPDTEIFYKVTNTYDPTAERGIAWDDPTLEIPWPLDGEPILSDKDKSLPGLATARHWFSA